MTLSNHRHHFELDAAEQYRVLDNKIAAIEAYDQAIAIAHQNSFIQDEALANELAAKFYLAWGKPKIATAYMQEAYDCYARWGAKAKTNDLEQHYPHLLNSKLHQIALETIDSLAHSHPLDLEIKTSNSTGSALNQDLDFVAILKASQSLSSTINLKELLRQLTHIILQSSGGDRCILILPNHEGEWYLEAISSLEMTAIFPEPLAENKQVPVNLIQYVKNSQIPVVIDNLDTDLPVLDDYLTQQQPKSILCLPILNQGELTGILYLHNQITSGVFTSDRIQILNLLCTQAAISLKNAQIYDLKESKAKALQESLEKLQQSEMRFQNLFEKSTDSTVLLGKKGFINCNRSFCNLFKYRHKSQLFETHPSKISPEFQPDGQSSWEKSNAMISIAFKTGNHRFEWLHQKSNQELFWAEVVLTSIFYDGTQILQGVVRDISDRKQAELELQQTNAELVRATRLKDEFLANMSHELRTPLNAILGMTEGLRDEIFGTVTDHQIKALQMIENSSSHLLELINDILDVAKIEAGQLELNCASISLAKLCSASLTFIQQQAQAKNITLETKLLSHLPNLWGDELRIRQVLINLLNNAVKFTPQGGSISLQITPCQHPSQDIVSGLYPNYLRIAIRDTGIGIAPEHINKLFQPFSQIDGKLNRNYEGTGLGLALVKRIVELHGGQVSLTSQVDVGSCFMIDLPCDVTGYLPFDDQSTTWLEPSQSVNLLPTKIPLILLAEDSEANIETISSYLRAKGYYIIIAKDGLEAINFATTYSPDLMLIDIQMPKMDGIEAIQQIRLDSNLSNIPIIALTALAMPSDQERCLAVGANDYLSKPVKLKQLVMTIQKLLNH
jgi:PAS domain S-box-containing protein